MTSKTCLRCGQSTEDGFHLCQGWNFVVHPIELSEGIRNANPLDRLSYGEELEIFGEDLEEHQRRFEAGMSELETLYLKGPLTHRVELLSVSGIGQQGGFDFQAIEADGPETDEIDKVLEFLNSDSWFPISLRNDEIYLCRLVSMNAEGVKYVRSVYRLEFSDRWKLTAWN